MSDKDLASREYVDKEIDRTRAESWSNTKWTFFLVVLFGLGLGYWLDKLESKVRQVNKDSCICTPIDVGRPSESDRAWLCRETSGGAK